MKCQRFTPSRCKDIEIRKFEIPFLIISFLICLFSREGGTCWILDSGRGICGNGVVEVWEECDCGLDPDICEEQCCIPPGDKLGRQPCKLSPGVQCSPSEGNLKVAVIFQGNWFT